MPHRLKICSSLFPGQYVENVPRPMNCLSSSECFGAFDLSVSLLYNIRIRNVGCDDTVKRGQRVRSERSMTCVEVRTLPTDTEQKWKKRS